jgi:membrane protease YdiL (CAAX protease family)
MVMQNSTRRWIILISPVLVVLTGNLAARLFTGLLGQWAWAATSIIYWGSLILIVALFGGRERIKAWFGKAQGSRWWIILAIVMGLISFPLILIPNIRVMNSIPLVAAWFFFAVINSICEETYWRGFLLDETSHLPRAFGAFYSTLLFTSIHPLMLGVYSKIQAFDPANPLAFLPFGIILVTLSLVYCLIYLETKSLRLTILSHFLSDLGNLSIFLFMNIVSAG